MDHINYHASILFLTAMSLDRVLATVYLIETRVHRTRKNATRVCLVVWLVSLASGIPFMLYSKVEVVLGKDACDISFPGTEVTYEDLENFLEVVNATEYDIDKDFESGSTEFTEYSFSGFSFVFCNYAWKLQFFAVVKVFFFCF